MSITNLFAKTTTVEISVVTIDKKKLTKSIINQIVEYKPYDESLNLFEGVKILGYVNEPKQIVIWSKKGELYKCYLNDFRELDNIDLQSSWLEHLFIYYKTPEVKDLYFKCPGKDQPDYFNRKVELSSVLSKEGQSTLKDKKEEFKKILDEIFNRQIFI